MLWRHLVYHHIHVDLAYIQHNCHRIPYYRHYFTRTAMGYICLTSFFIYCGSRECSMQTSYDALMNWGYIATQRYSTSVVYGENHGVIDDKFYNNKMRQMTPGASRLRCTVKYLSEVHQEIMWRSTGVDRLDFIYPSVPKRPPFTNDIFNSENEIYCIMNTIPLKCRPVCLTQYGLVAVYGVTDWANFVSDNGLLPYCTAITWINVGFSRGIFQNVLIN